MHFSYLHFALLDLKEIDLGIRLLSGRRRVTIGDLRNQAQPSLSRSFVRSFVLSAKL